VKELDRRQTGPAGGDPAREAGADLLSAIGAVRRSARQVVRQAWPAEPLPAAQVELLRLAAAQPGIGVSAAARELRLAPNTVSTLVSRLAGLGLLKRERALPDGRGVRLTVTRQGQRRMADWRDLRADLAQAAIARLSPSDQEVLANAVAVLLRLAEQLAAA
jgi:DNA-binding MarR family transcriptional regulator